MQQDNDNRDRMRFLKIDAETSEVLAAFWPSVEQALPALVDNFYQHVTTVPALAKLLGSNVQRLRRAQGSHWERLFSGRFDTAYFDGVRAIGLMHNKIGLEPRWYIGGYNFVLGRLTELAIAKHRWSSGRAAKTVAAINAAVMLDMEIAISTYLEPTRDEAVERSRKSTHLTQEFSEKVGQLAGLVSSAATQLQATAQSMAGTAEMTMQQASTVASAAEDASSNVQTVASSAEELAASIGEISRQVAQSAKIAAKAADWIWPICWLI